MFNSQISANIQKPTTEIEQRNKLDSSSAQTQAKSSSPDCILYLIFYFLYFRKKTKKSEICKPSHLEPSKRVINQLKANISIKEIELKV